MTTRQRVFVSVTLALALGTAGYEARQASTLRTRAHELQQDQAACAEQIQQLQQECAEATNRLVALCKDNARLNSNIGELPKLRGEAARLRRDSAELASLKARLTDGRSVAVVSRWQENIDRLKQRLRETPGASIPELKSLTEQDWFNAANEHELNSDANFRKALSRLRLPAEAHYAHKIEAAVEKYCQANGGRWPDDLSQIKPYLKSPIEDAILQRYEIVPADSLPTMTLPGAVEWVITQKAAVDLEYDMRLAICPSYGGGGSFEHSEIVNKLTPAIKAYYSANNGQMLTDPAQLAPYATTADERAALQRAAKDFEKAPPELRFLRPSILERLRSK